MWPTLVPHGHAQDVAGPVPGRTVHVLVESLVGVALAAISLAVMPVLARAKRRVAPVLGSRAAAAEAAQTDLCAALSAALLVGLGFNLLFGWWWADPIAGLVIAGIAGYSAVATWRAPSLDHACCG